MEGKLIKTSEVGDEINSTLTTIKNMSQVGHLDKDTSKIDYIEQKLKALLDDGEVIGVDAVKVLKQLQEIDKERTKRAMHLDMMMLKSTELDIWDKNGTSKAPQSLVPLN